MGFMKHGALAIANKKGKEIMWFSVFF